MNKPRTVFYFHRFTALSLSLSLGLPAPAFALRPRAGGLEEKTSTTRALENAFDRPRTSQRPDPFPAAGLEENSDEELKQRLLDPERSEEEQQAAAMELGRRATAASIGILKQLLRDPETQAYLMVCVASGLSAVGTPDVLEDFEAAVRLEDVPLSMRVIIGLLVPILDYASREQVQKAQSLLGWLSKEVTEKAIHLDVSAQKEAPRALNDLAMANRMLNQQTARVQSQRQLLNPDPDFPNENRMAAARKLLELKDLRSLPALQGALQTQGFELPLQSRIVQVLGELARTDTAHYGEARWEFFQKRRADAWTLLLQIASSVEKDPALRQIASRYFLSTLPPGSLPGPSAGLEEETKEEEAEPAMPFASPGNTFRRILREVNWDDILKGGKLRSQPVVDFMQEEWSGRETFAAAAGQAGYEKAGIIQPGFFPPAPPVAVPIKIFIQPTLLDFLGPVVSDRRFNAVGTPEEADLLIGNIALDWELGKIGVVEALLPKGKRFLDVSLDVAKRLTPGLILQLLNGPLLASGKRLSLETPEQEQLRDQFFWFA